jgi:hypothetical protein
LKTQSKAIEAKKRYQNLFSHIFLKLLIKQINQLRVFSFFLKRKKFLGNNYKQGLRRVGCWWGLAPLEKFVRKISKGGQEKNCKKFALIEKIEGKNLNGGIKVKIYYPSNLANFQS